MTDSLKKKIAGYTALAGSVLAHPNIASAQIIYTDVNPDSQLMNWGDSNHYIDLNNHGIDDFNFHQVNHHEHTTSGAYGDWFDYKLNLNEVVPVGVNKILCPVNNDTLPVPLSYGELINNSGNFQISGVLSYSHFLHNWGLPNIYGASGLWLDSQDSYLGVQLDVSGNKYYGWIRLEIGRQGNRSFLKFKEYAYHSQPNSPIPAGVTQFLNTTDISSEKIALINFTTDFITIQFNTPVSKGTITLTNTLAEVVYTAAIYQQSQIINMKSFATGIYFVEVVTDKGSMVKKVVKE